MKILYVLTAAALIASAAAHLAGGWGGGWGGRGGGRGGGGYNWSQGRGGYGGRGQWWGTQTYPMAPVYACPATNRVIIISDYIRYGSVPSTCIGTCTFQPNYVLSTESLQNYDKTDSVVLMIGPYSFPNTASTVLSNATLLTALAAKTNIYLTTIPVATTITDPAVLNNVAAVNALVQTARTTSGVHLIDYAAFYNTYMKYTNTPWNALQMCNWLRDQLAAASVTSPTTVPAVTPAPVVPGPVVPGTLAPF